jgi:hypothetical protein
MPSLLNDDEWVPAIAQASSAVVLRFGAGRQVTWSLMTAPRSSPGRPGSCGGRRSSSRPARASARRWARDRTPNKLISSHTRSQAATPTKQPVTQAEWLPAPDAEKACASTFPTHKTHSLTHRQSAKEQYDYASKQSEISPSMSRVIPVQVLTISRNAV